MMWQWQPRREGPCDEKVVPFHIEQVLYRLKSDDFLLLETSKMMV